MNLIRLDNLLVKTRGTLHSEVFIFSEHITSQATFHCFPSPAVILLANFAELVVFAKAKSLFVENMFVIYSKSPSRVSVKDIS